MVSVSNIEEQVDRFLNREEYEEIKNRIQRVPPGDYMFDHRTNTVFCEVKDEKTGETKRFCVAKVIYIGAAEAFTAMKHDVERLVRHVEEADKENDLLLERNRLLVQRIEELKGVGQQ